MSVMGMVDKPVNLLEEKFFFPVSFERVYTDFWYKFAEENELYWLKSFSTGNFLERKYFNEVKSEIELFKNFLDKGEDAYYLSETKYILSRIELFLAKLDEADNLRDDIVLYIG